MKRITIVVIAIVALMILLAGIPGGAAFLADWYWFQSLGFQSVFLTQFTTKLMVGGVVAVLVFAFLLVNIRLALRGVSPDPLIIPLRGPQPPVDVSRLLRSLTWPVALIFALMIGSAATASWMTVLRFLHRSSFGTVDPVFGRDVGYYVFTLPAIGTGVSLLTTLAVLGLLFTVPLYLLRRDVIVMRRRVAVEPSAQWHLGVLVALLFVALALRVFFIDIPSILYATTGPLFGASYTDLSVKLPALRAMGIAATVGVVLVLWGSGRRHLVRYTVLAFGLYFGMAILTSVAASMMQRLVVVPNELAREAPQLQRHITATREAWGLEGVEVRDLSGESRLTLADVQANQGTIRNVRLWDREPLLQTFGQLQEIRTYYDFVSVDDDRYWIDGEYRQVLLSPRELNSSSLPTRTFINERLTFTHGMGLTLGPVNLVTQEGLPVLFIRDLPPISDVSLQVTRPGIYYGELSNDWVFVNTKQREFDYPVGRGEHLHHLRRDRGRAGLLLVPAAGAVHALPGAEDLPVPGHHEREPGDVSPAHRRARAQGNALPLLGRRSVHDDHRRRPAEVDRRCVYRERPIPVLPAGGGRVQLHAEQRQGRDRCVRRHGRGVHRGPGGSRWCARTPRSSGASSSPSTRCRRTSGRTCGIRRTCSGSRPRSMRPTT